MTNDPFSTALHGAHQSQPSKKPVLTGLGDVVAAVAQPIAKAIDLVAGTDIEHCGGCADRRRALNAAVPLHPRRKPTD